MVGEEFGADEKGSARWILDPIDGTKNYVRGIPVWATLIALERDGRVELATTEPTRALHVLTGWLRATPADREATMTADDILYFKIVAGVALIALSPALTAGQKAVYNSWGPGKYDPRFNIDGQNTPLVLPPAYGLAQVKNETYTAEGPISYWNAYVAVTQMGGHGSFSDRELGINIVQEPDLVQLEGAEVARMKPAEFAAFVTQETEKWTRVVKEAGIKPE